MISTASDQLQIAKPRLKSLERLTMSKPISFGFGKPKGSSNSAPAASRTSVLPSSKNPRGTQTLPAKNKPSVLRAKPTLQDDEEDYDEEEPNHEELTGFSTDGAILSKPVEEKKALVIENAGNADWRHRARRKNLLPAEVQAAQNGQEDRKSTRLNSSHSGESRMPSSA